MRLDRLKRITVEEGKCGGRPASGASASASVTSWSCWAQAPLSDEILADYPFLEREDIFAAIEYAAHQADHSVLQAS